MRLWTEHISIFRKVYDSEQEQIFGLLFIWSFCGCFVIGIIYEWGDHHAVFRNH